MHGSHSPNQIQFPHPPVTILFPCLIVCPTLLTLVKSEQTVHPVQPCCILPLAIAYLAANAADLPECLALTPAHNAASMGADVVALSATHGTNRPAKARERIMLGSLSMFTGVFSCLVNPPVLHIAISL